MREYSEQQVVSDELSYKDIQQSEPLWNVPIILTPLVGREQDAADVHALLKRREIHLLTLFGTGGVGKTRLALQSASELRGDFADGVCFVPLAAVNTPELVFPAIAEALDIQEHGEQSLFEQLAEALRHKRLLLILDNLEQVITIAPRIEDLLATCPLLKCVVTSREVLRVQSEHVFPVFPLALPDLKHLPSGEELLHHLSRSTAVALFMQRVHSHLPSFQLTATNAPAIAEICVRLDGLPLAIELAAAHIRLLPPQALLKRLSQQLLGQSVRSLPPRQQTLSSTLDWSYNLLSNDEQRLFRCLSVFVGGWTLEAVEAVWQSEAAEPHGALSALEGVSSLLDKSLLLQTEQEGEEPHLLMLETVREYGLALLHTNGEASQVRQAHALYYLEWAEQATRHLKGKQQKSWLARLEQEQENLRAGLQWCIEQKNAELACRFGAALGWFWHISGHWSEGRHWLEAGLQLPGGELPTIARAKALCSAGDMAGCQGDYRAARAWLEESVRLFRSLEDQYGLTLALSMLGAIIADNDVPTSRALAEESVTLAKEAGEQWNLAFALYLLGLATDTPNDHTSAVSLLEQSVALLRRLQDTRQLMLVLAQFGKMVAASGDIERAEILCREALAFARETGYKPTLVWVLYNLAKVLRHRDDSGEAAALFQESLGLARDLGDRCLFAMIVHELAYIARSQHNLAHATTLLQESLALYHEMGETFLEAGAVCDLGGLAQEQGDIRQAEKLYRESIALSQGIGHKAVIGRNLVGLAHVAIAEKHFQRATRLLAVAETIAPVSEQMEHNEPASYEHDINEARTRLGEKEFASAWDAGKKMTLEEALDFQEGIPQEIAGNKVSAPLSSIQQPTSVSPEAANAFGLTPREVHVLRLLSQGFTNGQVAEQLVISPLTVNAHVRSIFNKLDVTTRSAATRLAIEHHLV